MSDGANIDLDIITEKNSPNLCIDIHDSFSSGNKSDNEYEASKSGTNPTTNSKVSSTKNFSQNTASNALFSSDNSDSKQKFSNSSLNLKYSNQKFLQLPTEPYSNTEIKPKSPKKTKFSMLKMVKKSKYKNMFDTPFNLAKKVEEEEENVTGRERRDVYGNLINKKNRRKVRVTFADEIEENKPLASVINIESFKKYNFIFGMPNEDIINKNLKTNCQCCTTF